MVRRRYCVRLFHGFIQRFRWIAFVLLCYYFLNEQNRNISKKHQEKSGHESHDLFLFRKQEKTVYVRNNRMLSENVTCRKRGIVFVKTHKTASTTLTNVVLRYAEKHKLVVGLPLARHWELAGYPAMFNKHLIVPRLKKYDVLCHHFRFDYKSVDQVNPGAFTITILREPSECFESGFSFFRDWPYSAWFNDPTDETSLVNFVSNPRFYYNTTTPWHFRAKNYMTFDLGFDNERNDPDYGSYIVHEVNKHFDLVLITERLDESLLLLKDMLCMESFDDIIYLRLKVRRDSARKTLTSEMSEKINEWNYLDARLYDFFYQKLDKQIEEYGTKRMESDLKSFRDLIDKTARSCVLFYDQFDLKPWISRIKLRTNAGDKCAKLSWGEVKFGDYIRHIQRGYSGEMRTQQPSYAQLKKELNEVQKSVLGEIT